MPAIANKSLFVQKEDVLTGLDPVFSAFLLSSALTLSARIGHVLPNLAAIVRAVRLARNLSQMEMGTNRTKKDNRRIFDDVSVPSDLHRNDRNHRKSGYFSLIANIEQGGRKTAIPSDFVTYLAAVSGLSVSTVNAAIAEDAALSTAMVESNPVVAESTTTVGSTVSNQTPAKPVKSESAATRRANGK